MWVWPQLMFGGSPPIPHYNCLQRTLPTSQTTPRPLLPSSPNPPSMKTHTPQIWGVTIHPPNLGGESSKIPCFEVFFEGHFLNLGGEIFTLQIGGVWVFRVALFARLREGAGPRLVGGEGSQGARGWRGGGLQAALGARPTSGGARDIFLKPRSTAGCPLGHPACVPPKLLFAVSFSRENNRKEREREKDRDRDRETKRRRHKKQNMETTAKTTKQHPHGQSLRQRDKNEQSRHRYLGKRHIQPDRVLKLGNGRNTVSRVLFRRRELTEPH